MVEWWWAVHVVHMGVGGWVKGRCLLLHGCLVGIRLAWAGYWAPTNRCPLPCIAIRRFKAEEGEQRLPCNCGAPNCTGFLN